MLISCAHDLGYAHGEKYHQQHLKHFNHGYIMPWTGSALRCTNSLNITTVECIHHRTLLLCYYHYSLQQACIFPIKYLLLYPVHSHSKENPITST